jgi:pimeloyl-ACP methyl ester carboxylesterase
MAVAMSVTLGTGSSMAEPRAHVYLLRGLLNIFSLGMDSLAEELSQKGVYATVHNHTEWQALADQAAANYKAGKEGPIIIIGHSLGADAAMEMAAYLGQKGVPVALVVPFDGTQTLVASSNIAHVLNLTQRNYAYVQRGAGFKGTLVNMNVSSDPSIDHINIDKSPRLHARVVTEVLGVTAGHRGPPTTTASTVTVGKPRTVSAPAESKPTEGPALSPEPAPAVAPAQTPAPAKPGAGAMSAPESSPVAGISTSAPAAAARTAN